MKPIELKETTLIGSWEEVQGIEASTITKNSNDTEKLDGLIIKGYETKFAGGTNTNGQRYTKDAIDAFIEEYFVAHKLNMPVDVEHSSDPDWLCGRVIYIESNATGFYYVAYIPRSEKKFEEVRSKLANGILQGFSKDGWALEYELKYKDNGEFEYMLVTKMLVQRISLVATPANGIPFEQVKEIKNATRFAHNEDEETLADMFNF